MKTCGVNDQVNKVAKADVKIVIQGRTDIVFIKLVDPLNIGTQKWRGSWLRRIFIGGVSNFGEDLVQGCS